MGSMLFYSVFYSLKYARKGISWEKNGEGIRQALFLALMAAAYFAALYYYGGIGETVICIFGVPLAAGLVFVALQKGIKKEFFEKRVRVGELGEDEVISESNPKKVMELFKTKGVVGESEIARLERMKVKSIVVLRGLPPFGPFIFLGSAAAVLAPDFFALLFL
jgi:hypothetical protein